MLGQTAACSVFPELVLGDSVLSLWKHHFTQVPSLPACLASVCQVYFFSWFYFPIVLEVFLSSRGVVGLMMTFPSLSLPVRSSARFDLCSHPHIFYISDRVVLFLAWDNKIIEFYHLCHWEIPLSCHSSLSGFCWARKKPFFFRFH